MGRARGFTTPLRRHDGVLPDGNNIPGEYLWSGIGGGTGERQALVRYWIRHTPRLGKLGLAVSRGFESFDDAAQTDVRIRRHRFLQAQRHRSAAFPCSLGYAEVFSLKPKVHCQLRKAINMGHPTYRCCLVHSSYIDLVTPLDQRYLPKHHGKQYIVHDDSFRRQRPLYAWSVFCAETPEVSK